MKQSDGKTPPQGLRSRSEISHSMLCPAVQLLPGIAISLTLRRALGASVRAPAPYLDEGVSELVSLPQCVVPLSNGGGTLLFEAVSLPYSGRPLPQRPALLLEDFFHLRFHPRNFLLPAEVRSAGSAEVKRLTEVRRGQDRSTEIRRGQQRSAEVKRLTEVRRHQTEVNGSQERSTEVKRGQQNTVGVIRSQQKSAELSGTSRGLCLLEL